jgi:hypothetical protein
VVSGATFSSSGAGTCKVQANSAATTNYLASFAQQDVAIARAASTTTFGTAPTATYPGNFTVSASSTSGGTITYSRMSGPCAVVTGATFSSSGAGTCAVLAESAITPNYLASAAQQNVTITGQQYDSTIVNVKNLPPSVTYKPSSTGTLVDFEWKHKINGVVVNSSDSMPSVTIVGPPGSWSASGTFTYTPGGGCTLANACTKFVYSTSDNKWDVHWQPKNAAVGNYYVTVKSGKTVQTFGPFLVKFVQ